MMFRGLMLINDVDIWIGDEIVGWMVYWMCNDMSWIFMDDE